MTRHRALIIVPTALTLGTAFCGFMAIRLLAIPDFPTASEFPGMKQLTMACWLIFGSWVFDMFDGLAARLTGTSGPFGAQLDSLCDAIGFGVAPAFLVAIWWPVMLPPSLRAIIGGSSGDMLPIVGCLVGQVLLAAVLIRLARFNVEGGDLDDPAGHLFFSGLPSPVTGTLVAALGLMIAPYSIADFPPLLGAGITAALPWIFTAMPFLLAFLMVSTVRYPDLPKHYLKGMLPRWHLLVLAIAVVAFPAPVLALFFLGYVLFFPIRSVARMVMPRPMAATPP